jgi:hypothetical protein
MKYHLLPISRNLTPDELKDKTLRNDFNALKKEMTDTVKKLDKKEKGMHYKELFYLEDQDSIALLISKLVDGDEIVLHGEGNPFVIGLNHASRFDLSPFRLAEKLATNNLPDIAININLLACDSAVPYREFNYVRDSAAALGIFFDYKNPNFIGYTGMIKVNSNGKYSVSSSHGKCTKGTHARLEDAAVIYNGERLVKQGRMLSDFTEKDFQFALSYMNESQKGHQKVAQAKAAKEMAQMPELKRKESLSFFFQSSNESEEDNEFCSSVESSNSL